jgi:hypothetical protein
MFFGKRVPVSRAAAVISSRAKATSDMRGRKRRLKIRSRMAE